MPVFTVTCKECRATLKSPKPVPAGKVITCPKCGVMFAAPKPQMVTVPKAEVVDDVEVLDEEEVEIVDENEAKKEAKQKKKEEAGGAKPRRRTGKPMRAKMSTLKLLLMIFGGLFGVGGLAVGGILVWKYVINAPSELVSYVPADSIVAIGLDLNRLGDTPFGQMIDIAMGNQPQWNAYSRDSATTSRQFFDKIIIAYNENTNGGTATVMSKLIIDKGKFTKALGAKSPTSIGGRDVFGVDFPEPGSRLLFNSTKVFSLFKGSDSLAEEIGKGKPSDAMAAMITKASSSNHVWLVSDMQAKLIRNNPMMIMAMSAIPAARQTLDAMKCGGVWVKFADPDANITLQAQLSSSQQATSAATDVKTLLDSAKANTEAATKQLGPNYSALGTEFLTSLSVSSAGDCVVIKGKLRMTTIVPMIQTQMRDAGLFSAPGSRR